MKMAVVGQVTCALQGYVQMCMRATLCSGDRHTTKIPTKSAEKQTWDPTLSNTTHVTVPRQACNHTMPRRLGDLAVDASPVFAVHLE